MPTLNNSSWIPVSKVIDEFLLEKAKNNTRDNSYFHPSEWYGCKRKIAYKYYESKNIIKISKDAIVLNPRVERIFDNGTWMHLRWTTYMSQTNSLYGKWKCSKCKKINGESEKIGILKPQFCQFCQGNDFAYVENAFRDEETMWEGHVDAIVSSKIKVNDKVYVLENECDYVLIDYKSINPFNFGNLKEPTPSHLQQMQIYLYLTDLKIGRYIYENKANQEVVEFRVIRDEEMIKTLKSQAMMLKYIVTHKNSKGKYVLPPRAHETRANEECQNCSFRGHCWA